MIPNDVLAGLRQLVLLMERDRDNVLKYEREEENKGDGLKASYWSGKYVGMCVSIGILRERIESWETDNERELEEMAAERSEKDCMWSDE